MTKPMTGSTPGKRQRRMEKLPTGAMTKSQLLRRTTNPATTTIRRCPTTLVPTLPAPPLRLRLRLAERRISSQTKSSTTPNRAGAGDPDDWASLLEEVADPPVVADSAVEIIEEASAATDAALAADTEKTDEDDAPSVIDTRIDAIVDADEEGSGFYTNSFRLIQDEDGDIALAEETDDESPAVG